MTTLVTSDLHYYHKNVIKFCPNTRPFTDVDHMNESLLEYHNRMVKPKDFFIHMGDFSFGSVDKTHEILFKMNGRKILIRGNHDQTLSKVLSSPSTMESCGVEWFGDYKEYTHHNGQLFILFHYPIYSWNKAHHKAIHLHGHLHDKITGLPGNIHNVCWDNYGRYVSLDEFGVIENDNKE